jgi:hypothetical protein
MAGLVRSIGKHSRLTASGGERRPGGCETGFPAAIFGEERGTPASLQRRAGHAGNDRRGTPDRVLRRPDPASWSNDELLALHEAVALLCPRGPLKVSSLRTAIAAGQLAHVRIAGRIYTTLAALEMMIECRRRTTVGRRSGGPMDWEAHLATLLPGRGVRRPGGRE